MHRLEDPLNVVFKDSYYCPFINQLLFLLICIFIDYSFIFTINVLGVIALQKFTENKNLVHLGFS